MSDLLAVRSQMAMSLAFHIVFAVVGMAMPLLMVVAGVVALVSGTLSGVFVVSANGWMNTPTGVEVRLPGEYRAEPLAIVRRPAPAPLGEEAT